MMWNVSDLINAIECGNSGFGFDWSFSGDDFIGRSVLGHGYLVNRPHPDGQGGEEVFFSSPSPKQLGFIGGSKKTEAKRKAKIENGRRGGRPHYFVQLYNAIPSAIKASDTKFPVELLPAESAAAFSIKCADFLWLIRWDPISRNVVAFHDGLAVYAYNTVNNSAQTLAKMLVEEIYRDKLMSMPEDYSKEVEWIEKVTGKPFNIKEVLPNSQ